jgi:hypothetical protein
MNVKTKKKYNNLIQSCIVLVNTCTSLWWLGLAFVKLVHAFDEAYVNLGSVIAFDWIEEYLDFGLKGE